MSMTPATCTVIPVASDGYQVLHLGPGGTLQRYPIIGWSISSTYGANYVEPVIIGGQLAFDERDALRLPDGSVMQNWTGGPRYFQDTKAWVEVRRRLDWVVSGQVEMGQA